MGSGRTRYEVHVGTLLSRAALATFRVPVRPTAVPRSTVFRFRIHTDRDLPDVLHRLTERDVQVLEIRRLPESTRGRTSSRPEEVIGPEDVDPPSARPGWWLAGRTRARSTGGLSRRARPAADAGSDRPQHLRAVPR
jgi:hypothetical protein